MDPCSRNEYSTTTSSTARSRLYTRCKCWCLTGPSSRSTTTATSSCILWNGTTSQIERSNAVFL
jgi:hypothetical protein